MFRLKLKENKILIIFKLLSDLIFLLLIFFALTLIAEGLLPGLVSSHISFLWIVLLLTFNIFAIYITKSFITLELPKQKVNKKIAAILTILATLLILNSLLKLNLFIAVFILILIIVSGYLIYLNTREN